MCNASAGRASSPSWEPNDALGEASDAVVTERRACLGRRPVRWSLVMRKRGASREM
jgi:hypothetical protein